MRVATLYDRHCMIRGLEAFYIVLDQVNLNINYYYYTHLDTTILIIIQVSVGLRFLLKHSRTSKMFWEVSARGHQNKGRRGVAGKGKEKEEFNHRRKGEVEGDC
jgi:spore coat protein CotH